MRSRKNTDDDDYFNAVEIDLFKEERKEMVEEEKKEEPPRSLDQIELNFKKDFKR